MKTGCITIVLGLGISLGLSACDKDSNKPATPAAQPGATPAAPAVTPAKPAAATELKAADLLAECEKDAAAVKTKYANKVLVVEGTIKETKTAGSISVTLSVPGSKWVVVCNVPSAAVETIKPLKKDQVVKMRGDFMNAMKLLEEVSLGGCELVK